jgi:hypothetical protein
MSVFSTGQVTVDTTLNGTLLYTAKARGGKVLLRNAGAVSVFIGVLGVTTATGFELSAGAGIDLELHGGDVVYGITASASSRVDRIDGFGMGRITS